MRTARSSSRRGGSPPGTPRDQIPWKKTPPRAGTPGTRSPREQAPPPHDQVPPFRPDPSKPGTSQPPGSRHPPGPDPPEQAPPPWTEWLTDRCKNITFANFAGGNNHYYCPQRSCGRVMFSQACVMNSVQGGVPHMPPPPCMSPCHRPPTTHAPRHSVHRGRVSASVYAGIPSPRSRHPPGEDTPSLGADPSPPPSAADTLLGPDPPCGVHAGRYGQQAGGTHPTGMHSCFTFAFAKAQYEWTLRKYLPVLENDTGMFAMLTSDKNDDRNLPAARGKINFIQYRLEGDISLSCGLVDTNRGVKAHREVNWNIVTVAGKRNCSRSIFPTMLFPELLPYQITQRNTMYHVCPVSFVHLSFSMFFFFSPFLGSPFLRKAEKLLTIL